MHTVVHLRFGYLMPRVYIVTIPQLILLIVLTVLTLFHGFDVKGYCSSFLYRIGVGYLSFHIHLIVKCSFLFANSYPSGFNVATSNGWNCALLRREIPLPWRGHSCLYNLRLIFPCSSSYFLESFSFSSFSFARDVLPVDVLDRKIVSLGVFDGLASLMR